MGKVEDDNTLSRGDTIKNKGYAVVNYIHLIFVLKYNLTDLSFDCLKDIDTDSFIESALSILTTVVVEDLDENETPSDYKNYWYYTTLADLNFFMKDYTDQRKNLSLALEVLKEDNKKSLDDHERQKERTFEQIVLNSRIIVDLDTEELKKSLNLFIENDSLDIKSVLKGKVGLALSGGGFRASFFHIGVLARLSELDILKSIESISTVSGGSIIGMYYYLKLKKLFETKSDLEIVQQDYIDIVQELEVEFLEGTQSNIRNSAFSNPINNFKVAFGDFFNYSRTNVLGTYYKKEFYDNVKFKDENDNEITLEYMDQLRISPKDGKEKFHPYYHNRMRKYKVPNLIINATNLNSGHCWIFTSTGMGELESMSDNDVDKNKVYIYERYENFKDKKLQKFKISDAVAASSAVPALFDPIILPNTFLKEKIKLVDGGVYDNQGIQALLGDNCLSMICSDASGYFKNEENPSSNRFNVMTRMTDNMMDVIKDFQYSDLVEKEKANFINDLKYIHLKDDLPFYEVDFEKEEQNTIGKERCGNTDYNININIDIQEKLASIRTDLDAFSDIEANGLMCSGYLITKNRYKNNKNKVIDYQGDFLELQNLLLLEENANEKRNRFSNALDISKEKFFKLFNIYKNIFDHIIFYIVLFWAFFEVIWFTNEDKFFILDNIWYFINSNIEFIGYGLLSLLTIGVFIKRFRVMNFIVNLLIIPLGLFLYLNKITFEKIYLSYGKLENFINKNVDNNEKKI